MDENDRGDEGDEEQGLIILSIHFIFHTAFFAPRTVSNKSIVCKNVCMGEDDEEG